jgi:hypothetical protein
VEEALAAAAGATEASSFATPEKATANLASVPELSKKVANAAVVGEEVCAIIELSGEEDEEEDEEDDDCSTSISFFLVRVSFRSMVRFCSGFASTYSFVWLDRRISFHLAAACDCSAS